MRTFAISDIHGCAKTFIALLKKINFSRQDHLYLLGDYIDRGPDSKGVIDHILSLQKSGYTIYCLCGNHEQMMCNATTDPITLQGWLQHGGRATLQSFGIDSIDQVPTTYLSWMEALDYYYEVGRYILVHAGLEFKTGKPLSDQNAMLWQRNWYSDIDRQWMNGRIVVHGHTPTVTSAIEKSLKQLDSIPAIVIDNGCVYQQRPGMGQLIALELENHHLHFQPRLDSGFRHI